MMTIKAALAGRVPTLYAVDPSPNMLAQLESAVTEAITAVGTAADFADPGTVVADLIKAFGDWTADPMGDANNPTGAAAMLKRATDRMHIRANWWPKLGVNCPADQPTRHCRRGDQRPCFPGVDALQMIKINVPTLSIQIHLLPCDHSHRRARGFGDH